MPKILQLSKEEWKERLKTQLERAKKFRSQYESTWNTNETMIFQPVGGTVSNVSVSYEALSEIFQGDIDSGDSDISTNYAFRSLRFVHSQMSANPPSVIPKPTSTDIHDKRAADVANHLVHYGRRHYKLQEQVDLTSLQTLTYGSGFFHTGWDPEKGDIFDVTEETGDITMQGDLCLHPILIWDMYCDPDATSWNSDNSVKWTYRRYFLNIDEAVFRFPEHEKELRERLTETSSNQWWDRESSRRDGGDAWEASTVEVYEYHEKGLPWNGMKGKHVWMLEDGYQLTELQSNPMPNAKLPYHLLTDVDIPGTYYGKTFIDYIVRLQDIMNRLDSTILDNIQAHGVARMVLYDGAELEDDAVANDAWSVINVKGTAQQAPTFINPPTLMPDIYRFREQLMAGIDAMSGMNESMLGQVKREMSGFSLQTAINAGNMVRRRLFNKYQLFVESIYKTYLDLIKDEWSDERKVLVTGKEDALSVAHYSGADLDGGFDLEVEYGTSFSLDPASRREEIMQLVPFLEKAGFDMKQVLRWLKLNDIEGIYDRVEVGKRRQQEIFDEMRASFEETGVPIYIAPQDMEDHASMLEFAYKFRMSEAYKYLEGELQELIERHIREREEMEANAQAPAPIPPEGAGGLPGGGVPPMPGGAGGLPPIG